MFGCNTSMGIIFKYNNIQTKTCESWNPGGRTCETWNPGGRLSRNQSETTTIGTDKVFPFFDLELFGTTVGG